MRVLLLFLAVGTVASAPQAQERGASRVWYTLANRVPILVEPSVGARQVGVVPRPDAVCVIGTVGRFAQVRYASPSGGMTVGFIERFQLDQSPSSGAGTKRVEQACRPVVTAPAAPAASGRGSAAASGREAASGAAIPTETRRRVEAVANRLALAQEVYLSNTGTYAGDVNELRSSLMQDASTRIEILQATAANWRARIILAGRDCDVAYSLDTEMQIRCR